MIVKTMMKSVAGILLATAVGGIAVTGAVAAEKATTLSISVKDHAFSPAELKAPANKPLVINVKNLDATAMEIESHQMHFEKVVAAKSQGTVRVRALKPGRYEFFDDFNRKTTGTLVVE